MKFFVLAFLFLGSCATASLSLPRKLEFLKLRPKPNAPGVFYVQEQVCKKRVIFCTEYGPQEYTWDLKDPKIHQMIIDKNMVLQVRQ